MENIELYCVALAHHHMQGMHVIPSTFCLNHLSFGVPVSNTVHISAWSATPHFAVRPHQLATTNACHVLAIIMITGNDIVS